MTMDLDQDENCVLNDDELELVCGGASLLDTLKTVVKAVVELAHIVNGGFQV
jgi:hypothetical protein